MSRLKRRDSPMVLVFPRAWNILGSLRYFTTHCVSIYFYDSASHTAISSKLGEVLSKNLFARFILPFLHGGIKHRVPVKEMRPEKEAKRLHPFLFFFLFYFITLHFVSSSSVYPTVRLLFLASPGFPEDPSDATKSGGFLGDGRGRKVGQLKVSRTWCFRLLTQGIQVVEQSQ